MVKRSIHIITMWLCLASVSVRAQGPAIYKIDKQDFNIQGFSEISPVIVQDGILFCSNRRFSTLKDRTGYDGRRLYNIYKAERKDTAGWENVRELKSERSTLFNNGPLCIAPDGETVYFTSEVATGKESTKRKFKNSNGIFIAQLSGTELRAITPFKFNSTEYNLGQPSISKDGKTLYFASDMPGSIGKSDIYYSELKNGEWSDPLNLGPEVNSAGSENYPSIHSSGKLYFTSDRTGGFGKLDVYSTSVYNNKWEEPALMPEPVNSRFDDFALIASDDMQTGYFSSNRSSDDDIFRFSSTIIRKAVCNPLEINSYCYEFIEENAVKFDTLPFLFQWKFSDGHRADGKVVQHCFKGPGTYVIQLDVTNLITKEVIYNEKTDTLVLEDVIQPYISSADTINTGVNMKLDAGMTNLPGWNISSYYWNFGDESVAAGREVTKSFSRPGIYNIQLIVTEANGMVREACVSKNITVIPKL